MQGNLSEIVWIYLGMQQCQIPQYAINRKPRKK